MEARVNARILEIEPGCVVKATALSRLRRCWGGVVPLSEHEQRMLEQIEQALYREDPKFGRRVRSSDPRVHYKRKLVQALLAIVAGAGLLAAGIVLHRVYFEAAGAAILALALVWAIVNWRQHVAKTRPRPARRASDRKRTKSAGRASFMERMEERWRRRQEGNRRY